MNRAEMVEKYVDLIEGSPFGASYRDDAVAFLDAILPQVSTVEELEALPDGSLLVSEVGPVQWYGDNSADVIFRAFGSPLTVVWRPES